MIYSAPAQGTLVRVGHLVKFHGDYIHFINHTFPTSKKTGGWNDMHNTVQNDLILI